MQKHKLGRRVVLEHGLICNVLPGLDLVDQLAISSICRRAHQITVPWNISSVALPQEALNAFPEIDDISENGIAKKENSTLPKVSLSFELTRSHILQLNKVEAKIDEQVR